jgi:hypothetical protein
VHVMRHARGQRTLHHVMQTDVDHHNGYARSRVEEQLHKSVDVLPSRD